MMMITILISEKHRLVFDNGQMCLIHDKQEYERVIGPWCPAVKQPEKIASVGVLNGERNVLVIVYNDGLKVNVRVGRGTMELTPYKQTGGIGRLWG